MLITNKTRTENWQLVYRLVLNGKIIWDNVEFESILLNGLHNDPKNITSQGYQRYVVSIGGWRKMVQSTIHSDATAFEVITAFNQIQTKLNLPVDRLFLPFFRLDIRNFYNLTLYPIEVPRNDKG